MIMDDEKVTEAVRLQRPLQSAFPGSSAARCIQKIADRLAANGGSASNPMDMEGFWARCLQTLRGPLRLPSKVREKPPEAPSPVPTQVVPEGKTAGPEGAHGPGGPESVAESSGLPARVIGPEDGLPSEPEKSVGILNSFLPVMERLVETLGSVSREMQLMRELIAGNGRGISFQANGLKQPSADGAPKTICLDLDAFLGRLQEQTKE
jgi:hypothetical protein